MRLPPPAQERNQTTLCCSFTTGSHGFDTLHSDFEVVRSVRAHTHPALARTVPALPGGKMSSSPASSREADSIQCTPGLPSLDTAQTSQEELETLAVSLSCLQRANKVSVALPCLLSGAARRVAPTEQSQPCPPGTVIFHYP